MKIIEFLKYYFSKINKKWWIIIVFFPASKLLILNLDSFYFESFYSRDIESFFSQLSPWWIWISVTLLYVAHVNIIFELWNVKNKIPLQYNNVPESYTNIVRNIERFAPEKSEQVRENFAQGYKCLTEIANPDIKTAISIHFNAYKSVQDFLTKYFNDTRSSANVQITVEISEIKAKFEENFSQLGEHNDTIGKNENFQIDKHEASKLIEDINDNLIALFAHF